MQRSDEAFGVSPFSTGSSFWIMIDEILEGSFRVLREYFNPKRINNFKRFIRGDNGANFYDFMPRNKHVSEASEWIMPSRFDVEEEKVIFFFLAPKSLCTVLLVSLYIVSVFCLVDSRKKIIILTSDFKTGADSS